MAGRSDHLTTVEEQMRGCIGVRSSWWCTTRSRCAGSLVSDTVSWARWLRQRGSWRSRRSGVSGRTRRGVGGTMTSKRASPTDIVRAAERGSNRRCVHAAHRRSPRGQAEPAGSHAVAVQRRDEVRTPPGNCRALHAAASVQIATATGEARACRLCGMADDPAGTTAGRQEASTFALSWSNSA